MNNRLERVKTRKNFGIIKKIFSIENTSRNSREPNKFLMKMLRIANNPHSKRNIKKIHWFQYYTI